MPSEAPAKPSRSRPLARPLACWLALLLCSGALAQPNSVVNSPHNLSAGGPGAVHAASENEVCIFCHAPHNATPMRPLWNRVTPTEAYTIYSSRALEAHPGQPTGNSKMCLSCHDGTIALGSIMSRNLPIVMSGGVTTMPVGAGRLGTDLSDDHPISFRYDSSLAVKNTKLRDPAGLPLQIKLDANSELQCTSCHDAHNNSLGKFLVMPNESSQLCASCHQVGTTTVGAHVQCSACHQPHSAPSGPYLLKARNTTRTCLACHDGAHPGAADIAADMQKISIHDTDSPVDAPGKAASYASCTDCHEPHTMGVGRSTAPTIHPNMGKAAGISISGSVVNPAHLEYEVCFRCHAETNTVQVPVSRMILQPNTRLQFSLSSISFHPVAAPGRNMDVPSLRPGWTTGSTMYCSDCHNSDAGPSAGGTGPGGVHGSNRVPLLAANYNTADFSTETDFAYALCYRCHERTNILADQSFPKHNLHVVGQRIPCSACHDSHGIAATQGNSRNNTHLINFDKTIVRPDPATGRTEYVDLGIGSGNCTVSCHGTVHSAKAYSR
jgi:predicted CXXCH cytochrome family protein